MPSSKAQRCIFSINILKQLVVRISLQQKCQKTQNVKCNLNLYVYQMQNFYIQQMYKFQNFYRTLSSRGENKVDPHVYVSNPTAQLEIFHSCNDQNCCQNCNQYYFNTKNPTLKIKNYLKNMQNTNNQKENFFYPQEISCTPPILLCHWFQGLTVNPKFTPNFIIKKLVQNYYSQLTTTLVMHLIQQEKNNTRNSVPLLYAPTYYCSHQIFLLLVLFLFFNFVNCPCIKEIIYWLNQTDCFRVLLRKTNFQKSLQASLPNQRKKPSYNNLFDQKKFILKTIFIFNFSIQLSLQVPILHQQTTYQKIFFNRNVKFYYYYQNNVLCDFIILSLIPEQVVFLLIYTNFTPS
eukprot:TRINITY_DN3518_c1_g2_i2.p1 TRINITY_DN3518_c1_g2~~TRINITY_DN3518_c1_g2_i2.p1  ORF type:complete len:365 (-),score=-12.29 TRINITY_DN3518_c1_g2_i2:54-1097(-)